jgi:hypothetical protein
MFCAISAICRVKQSSCDLCVLLGALEHVLHTVCSIWIHARRSVRRFSIFQTSFPGLPLSRTKHLLVPPGIENINNVQYTVTLANDQLDTQFLIHLLQSSTCTRVEQYLAHPQEVKLY